MQTLLKKATLAVLPLAGLLFAGCTPHERLHYNLESAHEAFHEYPHTPAEHRRFHEELEDLHRGYHDRGYSGYGYGRGYYDGGFYGY